MVGGFWKNQTYLAGTKMWDQQVSPLEVSLWVRLHLGWPLKAGGSFQSLAFNLSAASILRRKYSESAPTFADKTFAGGFSTTVERILLTYLRSLLTYRYLINYGL